MQIYSEIGTLKKVIVHRPDLSIRRLTPNNCHDLLFDDVLWPERALIEHDKFSDLLRDNGVEVLFLIDLLSKALEDDLARQWLLENTINQVYANSTISRILHDYLAGLSPAELASALIGGITAQELQEPKLGLAGFILADDDFVLPPLPNHLFTRDTTCWIGHGVSINAMAYTARHRETLNYATIYKYHPLFKNSTFPIWFDGSNNIEPIATIEGGDILVANDKCVLIGVSQRTKPQTIETLARSLFNSSQFDRIIAVDINKKRSSMHLDTVMTMIDHDAFALAISPSKIRAWSVMPSDNEDQLSVVEEKNLFATLKQILGVSSLRLIAPGGDSFTRQREQWSDASNLLAIAPGKVLAYERNVESNKKLRNAGFDVLPIEGDELSRGRGGARCMSCPLERELL